MFRTHRILLIFCGLLLAGSLLVGSSLAYFTDTAVPLVNTFYPSRVTTGVEELLDGTVKSQVVLQNTGSFDAYLRAAVSVTWKDESGAVYASAPKPGQDYEMTLDLDNGWVLGEDGFYYWVYPVAPAQTQPENCATGVLISTCSPLGDSPEGYFLTVEILGSGIQSLPVSIVTEHWGSGVSGVDAEGMLQIRGGA